MFFAPSPLFPPLVACFLVLSQWRFGAVLVVYRTPQAQEAIDPNRVAFAGRNRSLRSGRGGPIVIRPVFAGCHRLRPAACGNNNYIGPTPHRRRGVATVAGTPPTSRQHPPTPGCRSYYLPLATLCP